MSNILFTTLGTTWAIVPELLGFTNWDWLGLYRNHPRAEDLEHMRAELGIEPVTELWIVTTSGAMTDCSLRSLAKWRAHLGTHQVPGFRIWRVKGVEDLATQEQCRKMSEAIHRLVLAASEQTRQGHLLLSLAGGRKTMSSDMQMAASLFGCNALLHVVNDDSRNQDVARLQPHDFTGTLPADLACAFTPMVVGRYATSAITELRSDQKAAIRAADYPVPIETRSEPIELNIEGTELLDEIRARRRNAEFLACNYTSRLIQQEPATNFLALYSLPPWLIEELKTDRIGIDPARREVEIEWLKTLPKAELHCHLGGVLQSRDLIEVAASNRTALTAYQPLLKPWLQEWRRRISQQPPAAQHRSLDFKALRQAVPGVPEPLSVAAFILLFEDSPEELDRWIFGPYQKPASYVGIGFDAYERLGDLQGSGLLQSEESLRGTCRLLAQNALAHNVLHLELRCSPINYTRGGLDSDRVVEIITDELKAAGLESWQLIVIGSRHGKMELIEEHLRLVSDFLDRYGAERAPIGGFDLAGNEQTRSAAELRPLFLALMERCVRFTIHAGETADVSSVWEAVYHLNAERIGHGLTLRDNPTLIRRFKDRNIAIEMCPSSNCQIVGYNDYGLSQTSDLDRYPLKEYLDAGLRVAVCTDNPGISRTDYTHELYRAARMTEGGLSRWEVLLMVRNAFRSAFVERGRRHNLLRLAEDQVLSNLQNLLKGEWK